MSEVGGPGAGGDVSLGELAVRRPLRRVQADAEQDVRLLLDTARELMQSGAMPRVADIVRATGMSNDAFYRYFKTKDDLVAAIVDDGARRLLDSVQRRMAQARGAERRVKVAVQVVMKQASDPNVALATRNVFGNSSRSVPADRFGRARMEIGLADLLRGPLTELGARDPQRDALAAGVLIMGMLNYFLWQQANPSTRDVDHLVRYLLLGAEAGT